MSKLVLTVTKAGLDRFTAAQLDADIDLSISSVGLTDTAFVVAPTLTALPGMFRKVNTISGAQVGDNIVHMTIRDEAEIGYTARGFGLFLADGTLFAVYGQAERLFEKAPRATFLAAIDIGFPTGDVRELNFGNTDFLNPPATTAQKGVVQLATEAEATAGVDLQRVASVGVMAKVLAALKASLLASIDALSLATAQALDGLAARTVYGSGLVTGGGRNDTNRTLTVTAATAAEIRAGAAPNIATTPKGLSEARMLYVVESRDGFRSLSDGSVEMWGLGDFGRATEGQFTLNFPTPFPNECLGIFAMPRNLNLTDLGQTSVQEVQLYADRAVLFAQNHNAALSETGGFRWRAWGR